MSKFTVNVLDYSEAADEFKIRIDYDEDDLPLSEREIKIDAMELSIMVRESGEPFVVGARPAKARGGVWCGPWRGRALAGAGPLLSREVGPNQGLRSGLTIQTSKHSKGL